MRLGHHFQGQKVNLQGAEAYCGGLPHQGRSQRGPGGLDPT